MVYLIAAWERGKILWVERKLGPVMESHAKDLSILFLIDSGVALKFLTKRRT